MAELWWERERWAADLFPFIIPMRAFLEGRLSGAEYQLLFFATLGADEAFRPPDITGIIDTLSGEVDEFCADDDLRQRTGGLDEEELRTQVAVAQEKLRKVAAEP